MTATERQIRAWQQLRECNEQRAELQLEREHALTGKQLLAQQLDGAAVYPPAPFTRVRWPQRFRNRWALPFVQYVVIALERGNACLVISFLEFAQLAGCSKRSAEYAVRELQALGYVESARYFDAVEPWDQRQLRGRTSAGRHLRHVQRCNSYTPGPALRIALERPHAGERRRLARVLDLETERLKRRDDARSVCDPSGDLPIKHDQQSTRAREPAASEGSPPLASTRRPTAAADRRRRKAERIEALRARTLARAEWAAAYARPPTIERPPGAEAHNTDRPAAGPRREGREGEAAAESAKHAREATPEAQQGPSATSWAAPRPPEWHRLVALAHIDDDDPPKH